MLRLNELVGAIKMDRAVGRRDGGSGSCFGVSNPAELRRTNLASSPEQSRKGTEDPAKRREENSVKRPRE